MRGNFFHPLRVIKLVFALDDRVKAQRLRFGAALNDAFKAVERTAADEEDVRGIDVDDLLLRVLSAALWRDAGNGTLQNFEQCLLHALAADVTRDGRVFGLSGNLIDLIDIDDAVLGTLNVVICCLNETQQDVFDVFADIAGFRQSRCVRNGERNV